MNEINFSQIQTDTELGKRLYSVLSSFQDEGISVKECRYVLYPQLLSPEGVLKSLSDSCRHDNRKKKISQVWAFIIVSINPLKNSSSGESRTEHTKPERSKTVLRPHPRPPTRSLTPWRLLEASGRVTQTPRAEDTIRSDTRPQQASRNSTSKHACILPALDPFF